MCVLLNRIEILDIFIVIRIVAISQVTKLLSELACSSLILFFIALLLFFMLLLQLPLHTRGENLNNNEQLEIDEEYKKILLRGIEDAFVQLRMCIGVCPFLKVDRLVLKKATDKDSGITYCNFYVDFYRLCENTIHRPGCMTDKQCIYFCRRYLHAYTIYTGTSVWLYLLLPYLRAIG